MKKQAYLLTILVFVLGCARHQPLTKDHAAELIKASKAWSGPIAPQLNVDPSFRPIAETKREMLKLALVDMKDDGPYGRAGQTASVVFTWRWPDGYLSNKIFHSTAKLNNNGDGWKVYDDKLLDALWASERGDID